MGSSTSLELAGYTAEVAAQRLRSALNKIISDAHTQRGGSPDVAMQGDLPKITLPVAGLSLDAIVEAMRSTFSRGKRCDVAGDITLANDKLWLRLRMDGKDLFATAQGVDPGRADELFSEAAEKIFEKTDPFLLAASLTDRDPVKGLEMADRIVRSSPREDPSVVWAISNRHNNA